MGFNFPGEGGIGRTVMSDVTAPHLLDAPALHARALALATVTHERAHWSELAAIVGRVQDEAYFRRDDYGTYPTARAWAMDVLHIPPSEFIVLVERLWPMIRDHAAIAPEEWRGITKARAVILTKVLGMPGVDARRWFDVAVAAPSASAFQTALADLLPEPKWITWKCRIPVPLAGVIDEAMGMALQRVLRTKHPDPARMNDLDTKFRCLERVVNLYLAHAHLDTEEQE